MSASITAQPPANMSADELCSRIEQLAISQFGGVEDMCSDCATVLALLLRERGISAEVVVGFYCFAEGKCRLDESHAWVQTPEHVFDPTRSQFENGPLTLRHREAQ